MSSVPSKELCIEKKKCIMGNDEKGKKSPTSKKVTIVLKIFFFLCCDDSCSSLCYFQRWTFCHFFTGVEEYSSIRHGFCEGLTCRLRPMSSLCVLVLFYFKTRCHLLVLFVTQCCIFRRGKKIEQTWKMGMVDKILIANDLLCST